MALRFAAVTALLMFASIVLAQNPYANGGSGGNPYQTGGGSGSSSGNPYISSGSGSGSGSSSGSGNPNASGRELDYAKISTVRLAHGVLASAAFVFFFPIGAITIRVIPSKITIWLHAGFQVFSYLLFIAAFGLGVWLAKQFEFGSFKLIATYHPIIGIVIFALLIFQPILGIVHHMMFKKHARRFVWSYFHIWLGRILITLGIINGGLGLRLANNTKKGEIAYGVIAGFMWLVWMAAAVYGEVKRARSPKKTTGTIYNKERSSSDDSNIAVMDNREPAERYA